MIQPNPPDQRPPGPGLETPVSSMQVLLVLAITLVVFFAMHFIFLSIATWEALGDYPVDNMNFDELLADRNEIEAIVTRAATVIGRGPEGWSPVMRFSWVMNQAVIPLPVIIILLFRRQSLPVNLRLRPVPALFYLLAIPVGIGIAVIGDEVMRLLDMIVPVPAELSESLISMMQYESYGGFFTIFVTTAVLAPIGEELLFRGFLQRWTESLIGVTNGVLVISAMFALIHGSQFFVIPILLMATFLGAIAWRTESIWPAVIAHAVNNLIGFIFANVYETDPPWYTLGDHVAPWWVLLALILLVGGMYLIFKESEKRGIGGHGPRGDTGINVNRTV